MQVKNILKVGMILGAGLLAAACSDKASDPGTESKSDLNPPGTLWTVTQNNAIELRWTAGNVEEDLNGYYVFAIDASKVVDATGILAAIKPTYPAGVNLGLSGIPRCKDNTKFFEAFLFKPTDKECEDNTAAPATTAGTTLQGGALLADEPAAGAADDAAEVLTGFVKCDAGSTADISLTAVPPVVTTQKCVVSKLGDGTTALANGTTYAFLVMAARDDRTKISWTSNIVIDTPSANALDDAEKKVTLSSGEFAKVTITDATKGLADIAAAAPCAGDFVSLCDRISTSNTVPEANSGAAIFLSRMAASDPSDFKQRLYVSGSENGDVIIQPRGPQTWDPMTKSTANRIPGDEAASSFPTAAGTKYVVYNNQVFDLQVTSATKVYFGKLIVNDVTYAEASASADATLNVDVILQPKPATTDYFRTVQFIR